EQRLDHDPDAVHPGVRHKALQVGKHRLLGASHLKAHRDVVPLSVGKEDRVDSRRSRAQYATLDDVQPVEVRAVTRGDGSRVAKESDVAGTVVAWYREDAPRARAEPHDDIEILGYVLEHLGTDEHVMLFLRVDVRVSSVVDADTSSCGHTPIAVKLP